ncbi:MAG: hypothetical protein DBY02_05975 [Coprobacter fastidiosus]|nr:MAG: hypothetical protein DBY02_05975 [Coprobacter fastidiosus]
MCFLPVFFPVFTRQIARYPPHKNKHPRKKFSKLTRAKFRQALKYTLIQKFYFPDRKKTIRPHR